MKVISEVVQTDDGHTQLNVTIDCESIYYMALNSTMQLAVKQTMQNIIQQCIMREIDKIEDTHMEHMKCKH